MSTFLIKLSDVILFSLANFLIYESEVKFFVYTLKIKEFETIFAKKGKDMVTLNLKALAAGKNYAIRRT